MAGKGKWAENASRYRPGSASASARGKGAATRPWHVDVEGEPKREEARGPVAWARTLPVAQLELDPDQPRKTIDQAALEELAASVREQGVLQPVVVRRKPGEENRYVVVAGERRLRAAWKNELDEVPCMVLAGDSLREARLAQLAENLHREDLSPMEEARAIVALAEAEDLTQEEVGRRLGKSPAYVSRIFAISRISEDDYAQLSTLKLSTSLLYEYAQLPEDPAIRELALERLREGVTVRELEALRLGRRPAAASSRTPAVRRGRPPKSVAHIGRFRAGVRALVGSQARVARAELRGLLEDQREIARWLADRTDDAELAKAFSALEAAITRALAK